MRIGYDVSVLESGNPTGVEKVALHLFGAMWEQFPDDEHVLYCRQRPELLDQLPDCCELLEVPGGRFWRYGALARAIRHASLNVFISPVAALPGPCGTALVGYVHECQWRHQTGESGQGRFRTAAWLAALRAKLLLTSSHFSATDMRAEFGRFAPQITVTHPAPDPGLLSGPATPSGIDKPYFLFVSTIRPKKNLELMIRAFARPELADYELVCVGRIDYPAIPELAKTLGAKNVRFLGYQPNDVVAGLFAETKGFLYLSATEGFGLPILEAFGNDCPVLVSRGGSIPEVAGDAGAYVDLTPEAVAAGALELATDAEKRQQLTAAGRKRLAEFSWAKSARALRDALALI